MSERWKTFSSGGYRWRVRAGAREELERALIGRLPDLGPPLEMARRRRGRSFHRVASGDGDLFVKRLAPARYDAALLYRILSRRVRGRRELRQARRIHARHVPVPEPLAFGERHRPLRSYESLLVYRALPLGARPLTECGLDGAPAGVRRRVAGALARLAASLHDAGVFHMDLTQANVMLAGDPAGDFRLAAVDLETAVLGAPDDARLAVASLGKMGEKFPARAGERLAFLDAYRTARSTRRFEREALWRAVSDDRGARLARAGAGRTAPARSEAGGAAPVGLRAERDAG